MAKLKQNLTGQVFSRLTVADYEDGHWNCQCSCGASKKVKTHDLVAGKIQSCGCLRKEVAGKSVKLDVSEGLEFTNRYGTLRVIKELASVDAFRMFEVLCFCGEKFSTRLNSLRTGNTKSCGCLARTGNSNRTHGMSGTTTYVRWKSMLTRATNPNINSAKHYSDRGIGVCERWLRFENFYEDMGEIPNDNLTLERVNNDLGYGPDNCIWATMTDQSRNRKRGDHVNGIQQLPSGNWRVTINPEPGAKKHVGTYPTKEEAETARLNAEKIYWK